MGNPYYQPGAQRAAHVRRLFANIARRYDLINDLQSFGLHRRWKRGLARRAAGRAGARALDVCCGTGDVAFALAAEGLEVVGVDFTAPMLARARTREAAILRRGRITGGQVHWVQADALALPFAARTFDVVTVSYGLRNLADWRQGLREMWRVGRPGARMLVLDFGKPEQPFWRALYFAYLRLMVPWFGRLFCGDAEAYAYILRSLRDYPAQRGVAALWQAWRAEEVKVFNLLGGVMSINYAVRPTHEPPAEDSAP